MKKYFLSLFIVVVLGSCRHKAQTIEVVFLDNARTRDTMTFTVYNYDLEDGKLWVIRSTVHGGNKIVATGVKYFKPIY